MAWNGALGGLGASGVGTTRGSVAYAVSRRARGTTRAGPQREGRKRGIGFQSLHEALDTTTPGGRLVFHVFAALAEFIRELIVRGHQRGLAAARARGQRLGRPPAMNAEQIRQARAMLARPDESVSCIARLLGVSRSTLYKYVPELTQGGPSHLAAGEDRPIPDVAVYDELLPSRRKGEL
ncbi:helix-turn-helix domain-containing protein [Nocardia sp. NPDC004151]|uniref:helix-turn-helix domain-containing protein n=1 Tax=Nocardia sp. NPDC004151 TaxID=3364304 RepID=UPI00369EF1A4